MKDQIRIPPGISAYVKKNFREDFLFTCARGGTGGKSWYDVEVSKDNVTHRLRFNSKGVLMDEDVEPDFPDDEK